MTLRRGVLSSLISSTDSTTHRPHVAAKLAVKNDMDRSKLTVAPWIVKAIVVAAVTFVEVELLLIVVYCKQVVYDCSLSCLLFFLTLVCSKSSLFAERFLF